MILSKGKGMSDLLEALQARVDSVSQCLAAVISHERLPQSKDVAALLDACVRLRALLPLLEKLPEQQEYLLRMHIQNLPDYLAHLESEAQLFLQEVRRQTYANVVSVLMLGGLAVSVCSSLGCLVALGIGLLTGSALLPTVILCMIALAGTMQVGFLGYGSKGDHSKPSTMQTLLEQQDMAGRKGQVLIQCLMDVQRELQSREATEATRTEEED